MIESNDKKYGVFRKEGFELGKSVSLDIAALVLLLILIISRISRRMIHDKSNRIFLATLFIAAASTVFDIASVLLDRVPGASVPLLYLVHTGYLYTHLFTALLYLNLVISLTDTWHKLSKNPIMQIFLYLPMILMLVLFIANVGNQLMFSVEEGYKRGPWFALMYVISVYYIFFVIVYMLRYHILFNKGEIAAISAIIPVNVVAMVIQYFMPTALVEMFCGAIGMLIISTSLQRTEDYTDSFTRLMKLSTYAHDMKRAFYNDKHVYIVMLNISNFQKIQAIIGFDSATEVLKRIADKMRMMNRKMHGYANLYYLDNGRFRMVFSDRTQDKAEAVAEALNSELKKQINFNGLKITLLPFIIMAHCPEEIKDFKALMSFGSDFHKKNLYTGQLMFASKYYGSGQLDIRNNIDRIIEQALEEERFQVYYQPIYAVKQQRFVSAEALLRLIDPQYGFISPEILINAAEKNGAIHRIGEFVFEKVCEFIASDTFGRLGLDYIEVNLSMAQLLNVDLPEHLLSIMERYGVSSDKINLEITESVTAYDQEVMLDNFDKLSKAGLSFSLDDYGTGYSNMERVIRLPLKIIKLDKSFVDEMDNPRMWIFIKNTVKMFKEMNMEIVVEGVETEEGLEAFAKLACDFIQGYFFSKPLPQKEFVEFISQNS